MHVLHECAPAAYDAQRDDGHLGCRARADDHRRPPARPLAGRRLDVDVVEGRPPKTIDVPADDESSCRYCLADWTQAGPSAIYTFLYLI